MHCSRDYGVLCWIQSDLGVSKSQVDVMHGGAGKAWLCGRCRFECYGLQLFLNPQDLCRFVA